MQKNLIVCLNVLSFRETENKMYKDSNYFIWGLLLTCVAEKIKVGENLFLNSWITQSVAFAVMSYLLMQLGFNYYLIVHMQCNLMSSITLFYNLFSTEIDDDS